MVTVRNSEVTRDKYCVHVALLQKIKWLTCSHDPQLTAAVGQCEMYHWLWIVSLGGVSPGKVGWASRCCSSLLLPTACAEIIHLTALTMVHTSSRSNFILSFHAFVPIGDCFPWDFPSKITVLIFSFPHEVLCQLSVSVNHSNYNYLLRGTDYTALSYAIFFNLLRTKHYPQQSVHKNLQAATFS